MLVNELKSGVIARDGPYSTVAHASYDIVLTKPNAFKPHVLISVKLTEDLSTELLSLIDGGMVGSCREYNELLSPAVCVEHWSSALNSCCRLDEFLLPSGDQSYQWRITLNVLCWDHDSDRIMELGLAACVAALQKISIPPLIWDEGRRWWRETSEYADEVINAFNSDIASRIWRQSRPSILIAVPVSVTMFEAPEGTWSAKNTLKTARGALLYTLAKDMESGAVQRIMHLIGQGVTPGELARLMGHAEMLLANHPLFPQIKKT